MPPRAGRVRRREPAREVHRRGEQRVDELPAERRRVDRGAPHHRGAAGRRAGGDRDRLPARGRVERRGRGPDRRGPRGAQRSDRGEPRRHLPRRLAVRRARPVGVGRCRAADRQHHGRRRRRDDPRPGRRHPRARQRPRRRARGQGHRPGRLRGRRDQGLREHQRDAAGLGAAARRLPAGVDLPQPDLPLDTAVRGRLRGGRDALDRLRVDGDRRNGQRAVVRDPLDPGARRRHGLRAAAGLALPRGAAQARGQARGDGARAAHRRPRDRRVRRDGDLRAAVPHDRRGGGHGGARPDRRARHRGRDGHDAHAAARAARDLRPARVLAPADGALGQRHPALRRRGRRRDARPLAPRRRTGRAQSAEDLDGHRRVARRLRAGRAHDRHRVDRGRRLSRRGRVDRGPGAPFQVVPCGRERRDRGDRAARRRHAGGHARARGRRRRGAGPADRRVRTPGHAGQRRARAGALLDRGVRPDPGHPDRRQGGRRARGAGRGAVGDPVRRPPGGRRATRA